MRSSQWVVSDELWERVEPLLPKRERRFRHPGRKPVPDRDVLCGILYVLLRQSERHPRGRRLAGKPDLGTRGPPAGTDRLAEAEAGKRLTSVIARCTKVDLLCSDRFGYLNLDKRKLLYQSFTAREERKPTAVASNAPFGEWDKTFTDPRLCSAIADRPSFECTLIQTGTEFHRLQASEAEHHTNR